MITSSQKLLMARAGAPSGPSFPDWSIATTTYSGNSFAIDGAEWSPQGIFFKGDGTKMYICGAALDSVKEYDLSTAWDISSASYSQVFSISAQETDCGDLAFNDDGTKMYVLGATGDDVNEYALSTAWDISSASYSQAFSVSAQETNPRGLCFSIDGIKMYVTGRDSDEIHEYDLSTAWDISSASYSQSFSVSSQEGNPTSVIISPSGNNVFICGASGADYNEYSLSVPFDISTSSYVRVKGPLSGEYSPQAIFINYDGTKMYLIGEVGLTVYEYDIG